MGNDDSTDEIQNPQEILNDCIDENHQTDQSLHSGEQHHLSVDIKNSQTVDNICKRADSLSLSEQPFYSAVVGQPGFSRELQASPEDSNPKSPNRPTPAQESFLYKWQINVSNPNNQVYIWIIDIHYRAYIVMNDNYIQCNQSAFIHACVFTQ